MPTLLGLKVGGYESDKSLVEQKGQFRLSQEYKLCYYVAGDALTDNHSQILATTGLPTLGSIFLNGFCNKLVPREVDVVTFGGQRVGLWEVEASYTTEMDEEQASQIRDNERPDPKSLRPRRKWYMEKVREVQRNNADDGSLIQTTAGEPIIIEDDTPHPVLEITKYEDYPYNPINIYTYGNKTNENIFYGAPPGSALMDDIQAPEDTVDGRLYCLVTYVIRFRLLNPFDPIDNLKENGWDEVVPNIGYLHKPAIYQGVNLDVDDGFIFGPATTFIDSNGQPKQVRLSAKGAILGDTEPTTYVTIRRKKKVDFSPLNLEF